jgi:hypothetical protein
MSIWRSLLQLVRQKKRFASGRHTLDEHTVAKATELIQLGVSDRQIAVVTNLNRATVARLRRQNYPIKERLVRRTQGKLKREDPLTYEKLLETWTYKVFFQMASQEAQRRLDIERKRSGKRAVTILFFRYIETGYCLVEQDHYLKEKSETGPAIQVSHHKRVGKGRRAIKVEEVLRAKDLLAQGLSDRRVARETRLNPATVARIRKGLPSVQEVLERTAKRQAKKYFNSNHKKRESAIAWRLLHPAKERTSILQWRCASAARAKGQKPRTL